MSSFWFLLVTLVCLLVDKSNGLKCYTCSVTEDDADTSCADDVVSMGSNSITDCNKKYCTIIRVDYIDPKGKLASFSRNCQDVKPNEGTTEDSTHRIYQRSCSTDLCNSGSGKSTSGVGSRSLGDESTIYAPGTGRSSATMIASSVFGLLWSFAILRICKYFKLQ